jgi:hypothetical protein
VRITGEMISVATDAPLVGDFLRISCPIFPIWQPTSFGMVMYLRRAHSFSKIRDQSFVFQERGIVWKSNVDDCFDGVNVLRVKVALRQDMCVWRASFLTLSSPDKSRHFSGNLAMRDEFHQGRKHGLENHYCHYGITKCSTVPLESLVIDLI